jgi:uncharacterized membrane protein YebE (DUF533 family)
MRAQALLDQLLKSGLPTLGQTNRSDTGKYATGAAAGGALALLLGSKRGRKLGGSLLKYGTVAALGALAWNTYREWQAQQPAQSAPSSKAVTGFEQLSAADVEDHSRVMLRAMIAAAKSDGHMDERERGLVEAELRRLEADAATQAWVDAELRRPVEPAEVAAGIDTPEKAAEVYLASVLVVDETSTMERAYLDELARCLNLPPSLKTQLEARASSA